MYLCRYVEPVMYLQMQQNVILRRDFDVQSLPSDQMNFKAKRSCITINNPQIKKHCKGNNNPQIQLEALQLNQNTSQNIINYGTRKKRNGENNVNRGIVGKQSPRGVQLILCIVATQLLRVALSSYLGPGHPSRVLRQS